MKNLKKLVALCLSICLVLGLAVPAWAAGTDEASEVPPAYEEDMGGGGLSGDVDLPSKAVEAPVALTAEASTFSVSVPTTASFHIAADGTVVNPSEKGKIHNGCSGPVVVTDVSVTAGNGWSLAGWGSDMPMGGRTLAMRINGTEVAADGSCPVDFGSIPGGGEAEVGFEFQAPLQKVALAVTEAAKVVYTVAQDVEPVETNWPQNITLTLVNDSSTIILYHQADGLYKSMTSISGRFGHSMAHGNFSDNIQNADGFVVASAYLESTEESVSYWKDGSIWFAGYCNCYTQDHAMYVKLEKKAEVPMTGLYVELPGDYINVGETKTLSIKKIPENTTDTNPITVQYAGHLDSNQLEVSESGEIKGVTSGLTDVLIRCGSYSMYYNIPVVGSDNSNDLIWNIGGQHFMTDTMSTIDETFHNIPIVDGKVHVKLCKRSSALWCTGLPSENGGYIVWTNGGSGTGYRPEDSSMALYTLSNGIDITGFDSDKTLVDVYVNFYCSMNP